jgi:hypothetical protein
MVFFSQVSPPEPLPSRIPTAYIPPPPSIVTDQVQNGQVNLIHVLFKYILLVYLRTNIQFDVLKWYPFRYLK